MRVLYVLRAAVMVLAVVAGYELAQKRDLLRGSAEKSPPAPAQLRSEHAPERVAYSQKSLLPGVPATQNVQELPKPAIKKSVAKPRKRPRSKRKPPRKAARKARTKAPRKKPRPKRSTPATAVAADTEGSGTRTADAYSSVESSTAKPPKEPSFKPPPDKNAERLTRERLQRLKFALVSYEAMHGKFRPGLRGIEELVLKGSARKEDIVDGWGRKFSLKEDFGTGKFQFYSKGPDGIQNSPDDIR